jgi:hypothetical protein
MVFAEVFFSGGMYRCNGKEKGQGLAHWRRTIHLKL